MKRLLWGGKSPIAGRGLFTAHHLTQGTRIIQYTGEKIPKAESDKRLVQVPIEKGRKNWQVGG
jgi:SET domain-containing protein